MQWRKGHESEVWPEEKIRETIRPFGEVLHVVRGKRKAIVQLAPGARPKAVLAASSRWQHSKCGAEQEKQDGELIPALRITIVDYNSSDPNRKTKHSKCLVTSVDYEPLKDMEKRRQAERAAVLKEMEAADHQ